MTHKFNVEVLAEKGMLINKVSRSYEELKAFEYSIE